MAVRSSEHRRPEAFTSKANEVNTNDLRPEAHDLAPSFIPTGSEGFR